MSKGHCNARLVESEKVKQAPEETDDDNEHSPSEAGERKSGKKRKQQVGMLAVTDNANRYVRHDLFSFSPPSAETGNC